MRMRSKLRFPIQPDWDIYAYNFVSFSGAWIDFSEVAEPLPYHTTVVWRAKQN